MSVPQVVEYISNVVPLSVGAKEYISSKLLHETLPKGSLIHRAGEVCDRVYFLKRGLVRWFYYNEDGKDVTDSFAAEASFVTAFDSFIQRQPSRYSIELLEESDLYSMTATEIDREFEEFPETQRLSNLILAQMLEQVLAKNAALQFRHARDRFRFMSEKQGEILRRAPLRHIASYLGITPETLSRLRAQRRALS